MSAPQPAAQLARLEQASVTETPYGGRVPSWSLLAALWVRLEPGPVREIAEDGARPQRLESANAFARDHPDAAAGQRLVADGPPWRVRAVDRPAPTPSPGRMILRLERVV